MSAKRHSSLRKGSATSQKSHISKSQKRASQDLHFDEVEAKVLGFLQYSGVHFTQWQRLFEDEDIDEVCHLMSEEIINSAMDKLYLWYMESQLIPFTVHCVHKSWRKLIAWSYLAKDPGRSSESWEPDVEPECLQLDDWASNCLANVVFERDSSSTEEEVQEKEEEPARETSAESIASVVESTDVLAGSERGSRDKLQYSRSQFSIRTMTSTSPRSVFSSAAYSHFARNVPTYIPPNMFPNNLVLVQSKLQTERKPFGKSEKKNRLQLKVEEAEPSVLNLIPELPRRRKTTIRKSRFSIKGFPKRKSGVQV